MCSLFDSQAVGAGSSSLSTLEVSASKVEKGGKQYGCFGLDFGLLQGSSASPAALTVTLIMFINSLSTRR